MKKNFVIVSFHETLVQGLSPEDVQKPRCVDWENVGIICSSPKFTENSAKVSFVFSFIHSGLSPHSRALITSFKVTVNSRLGIRYKFYRGGRKIHAKVRRMRLIRCKGGGIIYCHYMSFRGKISVCRDSDLIRYSREDSIVDNKN
jgi:hypothetical protein